MSMDYRQFKQLALNFGKVEKDFDRFIRAFMDREGRRVVRDTKRRTPVDTGLLRSKWNKTMAKRQGDDVVVTITNPVHYMKWVEDGHRVVLPNGARGGYVPGRHMLRISMNHARATLHDRLDVEFDDYCRNRGI